MEWSWARRPGRAFGLRAPEVSARLRAPARHAGGTRPNAAVATSALRGRAHGLGTRVGQHTASGRVAICPLRDRFASPLAAVEACADGSPRGPEPAAMCTPGQILAGPAPADLANSCPARASVSLPLLARLECRLVRPHVRRPPGRALHAARFRHPTHKLTDQQGEASSVARRLRQWRWDHERPIADPPTAAHWASAENAFGTVVANRGSVASGGVLGLRRGAMIKWIKCVTGPSRTGGDEARGTEAYEVVEIVKITDRPGQLVTGVAGRDVGPGASIPAAALPFAGNARAPDAPGVLAGSTGDAVAVGSGLGRVGVGAGSVAVPLAQRTHTAAAGGALRLALGSASSSDGGQCGNGTADRYRRCAARGAISADACAARRRASGCATSHRRAAAGGSAPDHARVVAVGRLGGTARDRDHQGRARQQASEDSFFGHGTSSTCSQHVRLVSHFGSHEADSATIPGLLHPFAPLDHVKSFACPLHRRVHVA